MTTAALKSWVKGGLPTATLRALHPQRLKAKFVRFGYAACYRFFFARHGRLAAFFGRKISAWEGRQGRRDAPGLQEQWQAESAAATWRYPIDLDELSRYSVIAGYVQFLKPGAAVLDVGCGEGLLLQRFDRSTCRKYVGIDFCQTAIERASERADERSLFGCADAENFHPSGRFDVIVFNEVLYLLENPLAVLRRYEQWLEPGGVFITSSYGKSVRAAALRNRILQQYSAVDEVVVSSKKHAWWIDVLTSGNRGAQSP